MNKAKIVGPLSEELGEHLRGVLLIEDDFIPLYTRNDIYDSYSQDDLDLIHDELKSSSAASKYLGDCWDLGEHNCIIYSFSEGMVCHVIKDQYEIVISFDADPSVDVMSVLQVSDSLPLNGV